jgi:acyl dehydratase
MPETQLSFEDVAIGMDVPMLSRGPLTTAHLMRWSSCTENWHKIHYDKPFAIEHDKLPGLLIHGSLKQQFLFQVLENWVLPRGWVWKVNFQFRAMNLVGETLSVWARVSGLERLADYGLVNLDIGIRNAVGGAESTPGTATVVLPFRDGPALPNPFVPPRSA